MSAQRKDAPRLLLGLQSLEGPTRATRDRALEVAGRFREPESLAVTLVKALDAGADGVYATPTPALHAALAELRRPVPVLARLPVVPLGEDVDDAPFLVAEPLELAARAGAWTRARARLSAATLSARAEDDLAARVADRMELEAPGLGSRALLGVSVAAPITDLALATGHKRFFERALAFARERFHGIAGFETLNLGTLLARLSDWGLEPDFVIGPVNSRGLAMKPDAAAALAELASSRVPVLACEIRAGGVVPLAEGAAFARAHGAHGLVADLVDLDDVSGELRGLGPTP